MSSFEWNYKTYAVVFADIRGFTKLFKLHTSDDIWMMVGDWFSKIAYLASPFPYLAVFLAINSMISSETVFSLKASFTRSFNMSKS